MRVLVVSATFPPVKSGGADYAFRLCQQLAGAGAEVHVLTSRIENVVTGLGISVHPVMRRWSWPEMLRLMLIARRYRPDVINLHFHGGLYNNHPMITLAPTLLKRVVPNTRWVTHIESPGGVRMGLSWPTRVVRRVVTHLIGRQGLDYEYGTILRDSDRVILLSGSHRNALAKHCADVDEKCVLIPPPPILNMSTEENGAARQRGREMLGVKPDEFLIMHYGYINPEKGIETLLKALQSLSKQSCKVRLVMVGGHNDVLLKAFNRPNYVQELHDLSAQLGVADRVTWTGYYPSDSDHASLYLKGADVCVLPFNSGVYLNNSSFTAAAAHGLPIIATKGEFVESPFVHQRNVLLGPPEDPEFLAAAVSTLMNNSELRQQLSKGALELAHEWFSWDKALERTIEAFKGDYPQTE